MMPGARLAAAIDLLAAIAEAGPADRASAHFFRQRRYMGGKDRRAILDHVYAILRHRAKLEWHVVAAMIGEGRSLPGDDFTLGKVPPRALLIAKLALIDGWSADRIAGSCDGGLYHPEPLSADERKLARGLQGRSLESAAAPDWVTYEYPAWLDRPLRQSCGDRFLAEMAAAGREASLDLRVNRIKGDRDRVIAELQEAGIIAERTPLSPIGLRLSQRIALAELPAFREGRIEVQDEGSQIAALFVEAKPGERIVDFCAGAGGKTLAIAAEMANRGRIVACDILAGRVERAGERFRRAGLHNIERRGLSSERDPWVKRHAGGFDRVLVDAPCSGTGTWRRNPDARWRLKPGDLDSLLETQARILESAMRLVRPGGRLIYVTCSLLKAENEDQIEAFLARHGEFTVMPAGDIWSRAIGGSYPGLGPMLNLTPAQHGTDGFFAASLERKGEKTADD